jgi:hypothetical protein
MEENSVSNEREIIISMRLPTHIAKTNNKSAPNKFIKINSQSIYNGSLNTFSRAIVVENMHYFVEWNIPSAIIGLKLTKVKEIIYEFRTVINHGDIRRVKGKISWKKPGPGYIPSWDLNNLSDIWVKTGNDALVLSGVLSDDNAGVIRDTRYRFVEVEDIDDLELVITIIY